VSAKSGLQNDIDVAVVAVVATAFKLSQIPPAQLLGEAMHLHLIYSSHQGSGVQANFVFPAVSLLVVWLMVVGRNVDTPVEQSHIVC
jgi:hypothetical protein